MAISLKKISKLIDLDMTDIPREQRTAVKKEVGDFIVEEILEAVSQGKSPVGGLGKFKELKKEYADAEKGGNRTPNLELLGDMLDSLTFEDAGNGIEVGIFDSDEVPKADGHNNFSGKSTLPLRRFIPRGSEKFDRDIESGINDILEEFRESPEREVGFLFDILSAATATSPPASTSIEQLLSDEGLEQFLIDEGLA